jgi:hypothetical protein
MRAMGIITSAVRSFIHDATAPAERAPTNIVDDKRYELPMAIAFGLLPVAIVGSMIALLPLAYGLNLLEGAGVSGLASTHGAHTLLNPP